MSRSYGQRLLKAVVPPEEVAADEERGKDQEGGDRHQRERARPAAGS